MAFQSEHLEGVGTVVALDSTLPLSIGVVTGDGVLALGRVQIEGKREVSAKEFVRGHGDFLGACLGS